jgi:hypothetical protein
MARRGSACLVYDAPAVPHQVENGFGKCVSHLQRKAQSEPFGIAAGALAKVVEESGLTARDNGNLDPPRIGPAAAIKEDLKGRDDAGHACSGRLRSPLPPHRAAKAKRSREQEGAGPKVKALRGKVRLD